MESIALKTLKDFKKYIVNSATKDHLRIIIETAKKLQMPRVSQVSSVEARVRQIGQSVVAGLDIKAVEKLYMFRLEVQNQSFFPFRLSDFAKPENKGTISKLVVYFMYALFLIGVMEFEVILSLVRDVEETLVGCVWAKAVERIERVALSYFQKDRAGDPDSWLSVLNNVAAQSTSIWRKGKGKGKKGNGNEFKGRGKGDKDKNNKNKNYKRNPGQGGDLGGSGGSASAVAGQSEQENGWGSNSWNNNGWGKSNWEGQGSNSNEWGDRRKNIICHRFLDGLSCSSSCPYKHEGKKEDLSPRSAKRYEEHNKQGGRKGG